ncbi:MAG: fructose-specific PTS transporter subunit EIIC [Lachnospiraceae bacterium]|nr:fructose-specific PTS transporter subunit EIIC [bacterium]MDY5518564.1 fructose-specific PTS transporter subunit EIIC [Lachnospiraceae bacterium]
MRITDLLDKRSICLDGAPGNKSEALDQMVALMVKSGKINDEEGYRKQVYAREEESTTGIGEGIAIPHGKCDAVSKPGLAAMVVKNGVDFDALDGEPVDLIFLIAAPNTEDNIHLDVLSKLSVLLMDEEFTENLRNAANVDDFLAIIDKADAEKNGIDERLADTGSAENAQHKLLAVTSCPTGIAHTYMAAEGIEKAAKAHDCFVKVETRGSGGAKNVLTDKEIAEADCIIIAADAQIPMSRFEGKKVIIRQVSDGISKADELVELAISGNVPIYHDASAPAQQQTEKGGGVGHKIYTYLMNGVSHMLPFVVGGGILIALAFLIDGLSVDLNALPEDLRGSFGTITPVAALLKGIGGTAFGFMLPILAGFIGMAIGDRPALALGFVGGMMAIDMGGPFNKAAYVFGTAAIAAGNYDIMAAVMIGGMTPPCAIALATLLFKNKFTKEEREAGPTNFIMGLAFITEGAIPYAASDPLHVLPACIAGSAVAGAISMAFQCTLMAPHGGIFVFMVVGNAWMYLVALLAGTAVSTALLGILKKSVV